MLGYAGRVGVRLPFVRVRLGAVWMWSLGGGGRVRWCLPTRTAFAVVMPVGGGWAVYR